MLEELDFGPNGALVFCMEHLVKNLEWLKDGLSEIAGSDDEYFIFDCPGQIELYTHIPVLRTIVEMLESQLNICVCVVHVIDALFIDDTSKYVSGALLALTSMMQLQAPAVNVITKCDLKKKSFTGGRKRRPRLGAASTPASALSTAHKHGGNVSDILADYMRQEQAAEAAEAAAEGFDGDGDGAAGTGSGAGVLARKQQAEEEEAGESEFLNVDDDEFFNPGPVELLASLDEANVSPKFRGLGQSIIGLLETYNLVNFVPLDITSEQSFEEVMSHVDRAVQYGEDLEPREPAEEAEKDDADMSAFMGQ